MLNAVKTFWSTVRRLSGDDAYEQYLKHYAETHASMDENAELVPPLLTREEFFKQWQDNKWKGVKRCC
jgi:uncharacterized short protein YbdD (DUF466 family)